MASHSRSAADPGQPESSVRPAHVVERVRHALRAEVRLDHRLGPIALDFEDGVLKLEGELPDIEAKKLVLERAAAVEGVEWISDRLVVQPAVPMTDGEIRDALRAALLAEPSLRECALRDRHDGGERVVRDPGEEARGTVTVTVEDGVVTLDGDVPSLDHLRLAGVLAWWVSGVCDVHNWLGVEPPEGDSDDAISDAVRIVLTKDPFVDASQIGVRTRQARVTLSGAVSSEIERRMAVHDAWYVFGVDDVIDDLAVMPPRPS